MRRVRMVDSPHCLVLVVALVLLLGGTFFARPTTALALISERTSRVSVSSLGVQGDDHVIGTPVVSGNGRYVAFASGATNLVPGDTNNSTDVFVYDRLTQTTERVSVSSSGTQDVAPSGSPSISNDGRYVAFTSWADSLVPGDTNAYMDVFVRDRVAGLTQRVSVSSDEVQAMGASSYQPSISGDGRYVAFASSASNLVTGDIGTDDDVFVRDRQAGTTQRVSVTSGGVEGNDDSDEPSISGDGRYVAFTSAATNLVSGDSNERDDVFVYDRQTSMQRRASVSSAEVEGNNNAAYPSISTPGRYIAFRSLATNLVTGDTNGQADIFVRDFLGGTTSRVSLTDSELQSDGPSSRPSISWDGNRVAFESGATNLVASDTNGTYDVFVRDRAAGTTRLVSRSTAGPYGDASSQYASASWDARVVAFQSSATNLVSGDTNAAQDAFVWATFSPVLVEQDGGANTFDRWVTDYNSAYSGLSYIYTRWTNTWLEVKFNGTQVTWMGPKQPNYGMAEVSIDGTHFQMVDCYASESQKSLSTALYTSPSLLDGEHVLRIRCTGTKNAASSGTIVVLDYFMVNSTQAGATAARYDESSSGAVFTGAWIHPINQAYTASRYSYSRWAGTSYKWTFTGSQVTWIGPRTNAYGYAKVYIDGEYRATVDQYGTTGWRYPVYTSPLLTRGVHTIEIRPTGTKRAASSNTIVVVDALDVRP